MWLRDFSGFFLESPHLDETEALALVIQALRPGPRTGPDREAAAYNAVQKIAQALPEGFRDRILALAESLRAKPYVAVLDNERVQIHQALISALARKQTLRVWIREPGASGTIATKISPTRLALVGDSWRVEGRSSFHRRVETIRVAWISRVSETGEDSAEARSVSGDRPNSSASFNACLRFSARIAPEIADSRWCENHELSHHEDGSLEMVLPVDDVESITGWILSLGECVEVIGPAALRDRIREIARRVARLNAPSTERVEANSHTRETVSR